jgi:tetratricopeptide (TPR) repeat protein
MRTRNILTGLTLLFATSLFGQSFKEASRYMRNEQFEDAEKEFEELLVKKPKEGEYYYFASLNQLKKGNTEKAAEILDQGALKAPKCKISNVGKGILALRKGDESAAEAFFQQALTAKRKRQGFIKKEIGRAYLNIPNLSDEKQVEYAKKAKSYLLEAEDDFETKLLMGEAEMYINKTDLSPAIQQFIVSGYEEPNDPRPLLKEAYVYRRVKNYDLSMVRVREAIEKDPDYAPAYRQLAEVYQVYQMDLSKQRPSEENSKLIKEYADSSIHYFEEYLKRNNNLSARIRYVEALYLNNELNKAITEGKKLLAESEVPNIYGVIAYAYVGMKNTTDEEDQEGLKYFNQYEEKFVKPQKRDLKARELFFKGNLLFRNNRWDDAFTQFEKSLKDTAEADLKMYNAVQEMYYELGNEAMQDLRYIDKADSSDAAMQERAELNAKKKMAFEYAIKAYEYKSVKEGELNLRDMFYQGRAMNFLGENERALVMYKSIVDKDTNYLSGYYLIATTSALIDPTDTTGNVTAAYNKWLEKLGSDITNEKYKKDVENAYRNMAFYAQKNKDYEMTSFY